jgi:putative Mg2+ transporter-C (MgtC) family protein
MTEKDILIRMALAMLCGGLLGLERQFKHHPAGFRTLMLVCMGSALIASIDVYVRETFKTNDSFRLTAQVVTGVGFIGAGTIIQSRANVKGLTTAATLWFTAAIGLSIGIGIYRVGISGTVLALFVLIVLGWVERCFLDEDEKGENQK